MQTTTDQQTPIVRWDTAAGTCYCSSCKGRFQTLKRERGKERQKCLAWWKIQLLRPQHLLSNSFFARDDSSAQRTTLVATCVEHSFLFRNRVPMICVEYPQRSCTVFCWRSVPPPSCVAYFPYARRAWAAWTAPDGDLERRMSTSYCTTTLCLTKVRLGVNASACLCESSTAVDADPVCNSNITINSLAHVHLGIPF